MSSTITDKCGLPIIYKDKNALNLLTKTKAPYLDIEHYSLKDMLNVLVGGLDLYYKITPKAIYIQSTKTKIFKINFISSARKGSSNLSTKDTKISNDYSFNFWAKLQNKILNILKDTDPNYVTTPVVDPTTGLITVTGTKKQLKVVSSYINKVQKSLTKEVLIDVNIYSVDLTKSHQTGIDWSDMSLNLNAQNIPARMSNLFGSTSIFNTATFNLVGFLNFLAQNGNVNTISNPKIVTLNNQKAVISVGDTIYYKYPSQVTYDQNGNPITQYTIDSRFVGVVLDITPQISDDGKIILSIEPRISSFKDITQLQTRDMPPDTTDDSLLSIVRIKDGQTLVLGGLISNTKSLQVNGVPILKELPLIGGLFGSKQETSEKKELVFVITPHIINLNKTATLKDYGFIKSNKKK